MKKQKTSEKLIQKAKWVLYSGVALNTMLLIVAIADEPKTPKWTGE